MDEPTAPAPRCTEHAGLHSTYLGLCYAFGKDVPRPALVSAREWPCPDCGQRVYAVIPRGGRRFVMDATSGDPHACPPPLRVELDEERLASGLARAFDRVRDQRRQERAVTPSPSQAPADGPPAYPSGPRQQDRAPLGGIPRLTP